MSALGIADAVAASTAVAALLVAGWRVGAWATSEWAPRILATAAFAAAVAVASALVLGVVGLGSQPIALTLVALCVAIAVRIFVPGGELDDRPSPRERDAWSVVLGGALGWSAWMIRHPIVGGDGISYHVPEIVGWLHSGHPGTTVAVNPVLPFGSYPLVNEVFLAWLTSVAKSFVPMMIWSTVLLVLLTLAVVTVLRGLGVSPSVSALAATAVATGPLFVAELVGPNTDLPAAAWLVVAAALVERSRSSLRLVGPAALAAALAVGTKTTVLPFVLVLVVVACRVHRSEWRAGRALANPLVLVWSAGAAFIGGLWYVRNLYVHGSPLWPTAATPWGDPLPVVQVRLRPNFVSRPLATLRNGRAGEYRRALSGHLVALATAAPLGAVAGRRLAWWCGLGTVAGALLWAIAPTTGVSSDPFLALGVVGAVRYLMPTLVVACATLALASNSAKRWSSRTAAWLLVATIVWNVAELVSVGSPIVPSPAFLFAGVSGGAAVIIVRRRPEPRTRASVLVAPALGLVAAAGLTLAVAIGTDGFTRRHARAFGTGGGVIQWLDDHPQVSDRDIAMGPAVNGMFTGDTLQRDVVLIPASEPCDQVRARMNQQIVILVVGVGREGVELGTRLDGCLHGITPALVDGGYSVYVTP